MAVGPQPPRKQSGRPSKISKHSVSVVMRAWENTLSLPHHWTLWGIGRPSRPFLLGWCGTAAFPPLVHYVLSQNVTIHSNLVSYFLVCLPPAFRLMSTAMVSDIAYYFALPIVRVKIMWNHNYLDRKSWGKCSKGNQPCALKASSWAQRGKGLCDIQ